ncbi:unnamed protein product [Symbiodinium sp. CCMP2592]|nr:unnamed protein product [Symbiodinium sp. CCMP2592]
MQDNNLGQWGHRFREEHTELVKRWWELRKDFIKEFRKQDGLFHEYQEQGSDTEDVESEDVPSEGRSEEDSGDEADAEPADPGVRTPAASSVRAAGEAEAEVSKTSEASPSQAPKLKPTAEVEMSSEASPAGSLALQDKIPSRTLSLPSSIARSGSMSTIDTGLVMSTTRTLHPSEWSSWFKVKVSTRKGFGLFSKSCRPPRELSTAPPRLLFPVLRAVDALEQPKGLQPLDAEEIEALREEQALRWAQVLASRFLARRARLYARTGHHLVASRLSDRVAACESCAMFISPSELHWSCPSCVFNICKTCAGDIMAGKRPRGKLMKPGISLYSAKYGLSLVMLCYALLNNKAVLKEEERSFSQSLQESSFSVATLLLIVAHLTMLISDRIFFKAHYSTRSKRTLHIIELISMVIFLAEFVFLHWHTIAILWTSVNAREATISLASDFELCIYYICGMLYLIICMLQVKHSLPSLSNDSLRPKTSSLFSASSIISEKIRYFAFMIHYNMPFVDDIRIIVDWTVAPTSLDLWMYWKVEDAHTAFYRSRHVMFVRSQSYYAEERDPLEKIYSGWAILCLVVLVILMPIIVFSPFSPFPNTVLIDEATLSLELTVASACYGVAHERELCRYVALQLFESPASQIQNYNNSAKQQYLRDNPRVNTDIDIQDVMWPWYSQGRLKASPAAVTEVQRLLDHAGADDGPPVALAYVLRYTLQRAVLGSTEYVKSVCSCAPADSCGQGDDSMWPSRIVHLCRPTAATSDVSQTSVSEPMDLLINQSRDWWREASTAGTEEARITLPKIWSRSVNLGNDGLTPQAPAMEDFFYGIAPVSANCTSPSGLVSCARHRWGRLWSNILVPDPDNSSALPVEEPTPLRLQVELEKSVNVQGVTGEASSSYTSALGLYAAVVLVAGKYLRAAFQGASKQAIYDEIPDAHVFLDIIEAIKMAREHNDLRIEFELYYCLMQVLRSTHILLRTGGHQPRVYGIGRAKQEHIKGDVDEEVVRL